MHQALVNHYWERTIKVKEAPSSAKIYNSFSRACKDNMPQNDAELFSKGSFNKNIKDIILDQYGK